MAKCDICGKYCEDCHNVYGNISIQTKKNNSKKMKNVNELCDINIDEVSCEHCCSSIILEDD